MAHVYIRPLVGRTTFSLILKSVVRPTRGREGVGDDCVDPPFIGLRPRMGARIRRTSTEVLFILLCVLLDGLKELLIWRDSGEGNGGLFLVSYFVEEGLATIGESNVGYL